MKTLFAIVATVLLSNNAHAAELVQKSSPHSVQITMDKLAAAVEGAGARIAARVDHAKAADSVGIDLAANQVLIFGNPNIGSPIFAENPAAGLDLPIRVVVFEDVDGQTVVAYHDPAALAESFGLSVEMQSFQMMTGALNNLTNAAISE
jgi:uncharacterized protein (DUF302 family)